jgi:hypothetical protein
VKLYRGGHSLRQFMLEYKVNLCFSMVDSRIASGRDGVLEASVIRSEIRSRAELNCALPLFLHLHTNEYRAQTHWYRSTTYAS